METLNKLKQFDAYPKTLEDFRIKTCGGATGEPMGRLVTRCLMITGARQCVKQTRECKAMARTRALTIITSSLPACHRDPHMTLFMNELISNKLITVFCFSVTIISGLIMLILFFSELQYYLTKEVGRC